MRKLFSAVAAILVFAIVFTVTASAATGDEVWSPTDGKYAFTYELSEAGLTSVEDGTMFGMLVLDELDPEFEALEDSDIKYIDQVNSKDGSIEFKSFAPMSTTASQYYVYIGGGALPAATRIGQLSIPAPVILPESVSLNTTSTTLIVGDVATGSVTLTETVLPAGATYTAEWTSSVPSVATVDNGVVTAVAPGDTVITVTVATGVSATCAIHVDAPELTGIAVNKSTLRLVIDGTETLTVVPVPAKAEITGTPAWVSDAPSIADVDAATGLVTAKAEGIANITVTVDGHSATCAVTVTVGVPGDMDGDADCDEDDAIHLLFHYLIDADDYPLSGDGDVDSSGAVDEDDAIHLLFHYLIDADDYPLYPNK